MKKKQPVFSKYNTEGNKKVTEKVKDNGFLWRGGIANTPKKPDYI